MVIRNTSELLSHGNLSARKNILDIVDHALRVMDSYGIVRELVHLKGHILTVGSLHYDLTRIPRIYVVGAGKGVSRIAEALESILGDKIERGIVVEKRGQKRPLRKVEVVEAGHPVPDEDSVRGAVEITKIADLAKQGDLVFVCVAGGCSALMTLPAKGLTLEDIRVVTRLLLACGADIQEINAVRKRVSDVMGGKLALHIHPAKMVNLIVIDEVLDLPWGPTVPDTTTSADAIRVLRKYDLWYRISEPMREYLERASPTQETPKVQDFERMGIKSQNVVLSDIKAACLAAREKAEELGLRSLVLSTSVEGESRDVGFVLASIAREIEKYGRPIEPPCAIIAGGETTVTILGRSGEGGRNQELALAASLKIDGSTSIALAAIGTDGTDGPTDMAGGIVDGHTVRRAVEAGIDLTENLKVHNSSHVLKQLGDAIVTGPTGTNVMDLLVIVVEREEILCELDSLGESN